MEKNFECTLLLLLVGVKGQVRGCGSSLFVSYLQVDGGSMISISELGDYTSITKF